MFYSATKARIDRAVADCLDACTSGWLPLAHLAAFLARLEGDPSWPPNEIQQVESRVRLTLAKMADPDWPVTQSIGRGAAMPEER
jgi:hypothetical protein